MDDPNSEQWCRLALDTRTVLDLLGYDLPSCLPGEAAAGLCGHSCQEHVASNLGALREVVGAQIVRLRLEDAPSVMTGLRSAHEVLARQEQRDSGPLPRIAAPCPWQPV